MHSRSLLSEIAETRSLTESDCSQMLILMEQYFDNVEAGKFYEDLMDKTWVILLRDPEIGRIKGFSTITMMEMMVEDRRIKAFYSGDTIIDKTCWKPFSLEKEWAPFVFSHALADPGALWYWFLVCKGFRTYKYLPVHFHEFWPSPESLPPLFQRQVLDALAIARFGRSYDPRSFIINCPSDYRLKPGVADISPQKSKNRYIRFFETSNPGWAMGAELACIAPLRMDNVKSSIRRFLPSSSAHSL